MKAGEFQKAEIGSEILCHGSNHQKLDTSSLQMVPA